MSEQETYQYLEYKDDVLRYRIDRLEPGQTISVGVKLTAQRVETNKQEEKILQYFKVIDQDTTYFSNYMEKSVKQSRIEIDVKQTTNRTEKKIKNGDEVKFFITIENKGVIEKDITIEDEIPYGLMINKIRLKTKDREMLLEDEMNLLVEHVVINPGEIIELEIDTTVDTTTMTKQEIENYVRIKGINISGESNKISLFIELDQEQNSENNENDNQDNKGDDSSSNENLEETPYSISGRAWIDTNENGKQDSGEMGISDIPVFLINESTKEQLMEKTKEDGIYTFDKIKKGNYIIIFQYDPTKYVVTTYQKEGVSQELNSDVMKGKLTIGDETVTIAKTKTLRIESQNLENINAGFVEGKKQDFKIDKTIQQVIVENKKETKVYSYNQSKLAKIEIDAKQIENSNVMITYNIAIQNQGEVARIC